MSSYKLNRRTWATALCTCAALSTAVNGIDYQIKYVPDLDQKRAVGAGIPGLPGSGFCHCVPTSIFNWMAFLTNRGYPQLGPPGSWQDPDRYNFVTSALDSLGTQMLTIPRGPDPNNPGEDLPCGTDGDLAKQVLEDRLDSAAPGHFVVSAFYSSGTYCPTYPDLVNAMLSGSLVQMRYGHYQLVSTNPPSYNSDGGHRVSLVGVLNYNTPLTVLRFRDPAGEPPPVHLTQQSTFTTSESGVQTGAAIFNGNFRTQTRLTSFTSPKFITGYIQIKPKFGLHVPNCCNDLQMQAMNPIPAIHGNPPMNATYASPSGTPFIDVAIHPEQHRYFAITAGAVGGGPAKLWEIDPLGSIPPDPIMDLGNPQGMAFDAQGILFVRDGMLLRVIDPDAAPPIGPQIGSVTLTTAADGGVEHHDVWKETAYVSADHTQMVFVKWNSGSPAIQLRRFSGGVNIQGTPSIVADHRTGRYLVMGSLGSVVYIVEDDGMQMVLIDQIPVTNSPGPAEIHFVEVAGGGERAGVDNGGVIEVYEKSGGTWQQTVNHPFAGLPAGKHLQLASGRTNYEPPPTGGLLHEDVLPTEFAPEVLDCLADIAPSPLGDGVVGIQDLLRVIATWGPCAGTPENCDGDIAPENYGNQQVNIQDLLLVISRWGPCP